MTDYVMNCRIMSTKASPVIIIPARMAANRLPGKPLADIAGKPMICHVWERAMAAAVAPVWVATDDAEIASVVRNAGGEAVLTRADHPSGSDRTFEAVSLIDPDGQYNLVLNLQGDLPEMDETIPSILLRTATASGADLTTLVGAPPLRRRDRDPNPIPTRRRSLSSPRAPKISSVSTARRPRRASSSSRSSSVGVRLAAPPRTAVPVPPARRSRRVACFALARSRAVASRVVASRRVATARARPRASTRLDAPKTSFRFHRCLYFKIRDARASRTQDTLRTITA